MFRRFLSLSAIVATCSAADPRPTLDEWKAGQEAEQAQEIAVENKEKKMSAVNKAVELMERLKTQILQEGEAEVATYNKFACFCKDTTAEKLASLQRNEGEQTVLTTNIGEWSTKRDDLDSDIQGNLDDIKTTEEEMAQATKTRKDTLKEYESNVADLTGALEGLRGAIKTLKASRVPSLVQVKSVSQTLRTAALLADALGLGGKATNSAAVFLQQPDVQMEDYKFHSEDIISTLEGLLTDFTDKKSEVDKAEVQSVQEYDVLMQEKTSNKKRLNHELDQNREAREKKISEIAEASQELSTVESTIREDKEYTSKLSKMCSDKAKTWDQRSQARAAELQTLTQAIHIIAGAVATNTTANTIRFAQQGMTVRLAKAVASNSRAMGAIEWEAEEAETPSFVQVASRLRGSMVKRHPERTGEASRDVIIRLLKSQGQHLKSTLLSALASKIEADPFAKVKQLIQELIERLLQQAANEANQKGWCDKATSDATQKRDYAAEKIAELNAEMARLNAKSERLAEEIGELTKDIVGLGDARRKAETERADEKAQNQRTVEEAEAGRDDLNTAIELLDRFYKTQAKNIVNLTLVQEPSDDAPDAGFEIGEAYTGAQSEAGGILGMLDVMKSDFTRTITETNMAEAQAEQDHLEFMTETGKSLAQKEEARSQKNEQKMTTDQEYSAADTTLFQQAAIVTGSIQELMELKAVCVDTGMSYDERVARREEEIQSLQKAMCILMRYEEYGPEGAADGC